MSLSPLKPMMPAQQLNLVSSMLTGVSSQLAAQPFAPQAFSGDGFAMKNPASLFGKASLPAIGNSMSFGAESPAQQIVRLGQKYGVPYNANLDKYQSDVIKSIIRSKAADYGIPEHVALGISGNESGWKMWKNVAKGELVAGRNVRDGELSSTDWGAMQINDKAHAKAFPRAKTDIEFNVDYALKFLARQRQSIKGDLGHGLGDWDRTVASYNLGHNPNSQRGYQIAARYVGHVADRASQFA